MYCVICGYRKENEFIVQSSWALLKQLTWIGIAVYWASRYVYYTGSVKKWFATCLSSTNLCRRHKWSTRESYGRSLMKWVSKWHWSSTNRCIFLLVEDILVLQPIACSQSTHLSWFRIKISYWFRDFRTCWIVLSNNYIVTLNKKYTHVIKLLILKYYSQNGTKLSYLPNWTNC